MSMNPVQPLIVISTELLGLGKCIHQASRPIRQVENISTLSEFGFDLASLTAGTCPPIQRFRFKRSPVKQCLRVSYGRRLGFLRPTFGAI